jgi:hypothetical protein
MEFKRKKKWSSYRLGRGWPATHHPWSPPKGTDNHPFSFFSFFFKKIIFKFYLFIFLIDFIIIIIMIDTCHYHISADVTSYGIC